MKAMNMPFEQKNEVYAAISTAIHFAIKEVGGIAGLKSTALFPSSSKKASSLPSSRLAA
jgi:hypothetical protein